MDTDEQGYESTRFDSVVDENYICPICMNVLKDPVQCQRNEHYFCTPCIRKHLKRNSNTCPTCRDELTLETLGKSSRLVTRYLSNLKIRCDYFNRGCREVALLGDLETHVKNCGFAAVRCSNEGCVAQVNKRDKIYHETEVCEFRKFVKCHDCSAVKKDCTEIKKDVGAMKKEVEDVKMNMKELKDQLNQMHINQEEIMKDVGALTEIKDQLKIVKELKDVVDEMMEFSQIPPGFPPPHPPHLIPSENTPFPRHPAPFPMPPPWRGFGRPRERRNPNV